MQTDHKRQNDCRNTTEEDDTFHLPALVLSVYHKQLLECVLKYSLWLINSWTQADFLVVLYTHVLYTHVLHPCSLSDGTFPYMQGWQGQAAGTLGWVCVFYSRHLTAFFVSCLLEFVTFSIQGQHVNDSCHASQLCGGPIGCCSHVAV